MREVKPTEAEILDVLLGDADPALEERVRHAVHTDLKVAALYARWARVAGRVRSETDPLRAGAKRVSQRVRQKLSEGFGEENASDPASPFFPDFVEDSVVCALLGPEVSPRRRGFIWGSAIAALFFLIAGASYWAFQDRMRNTFLTESVTGEVFLLSESRETPVERVEAGQRRPFPASFRVGPNGRMDLRLPHGSFLAVSSGVDIHLAHARLARQDSGSVFYRVTRKEANLSDYTVLVPQGTIVDLGTEFEVTVRDEQRAVVRVDSGQVRVLPHTGREVIAREGEQAILTPIEAVTELRPLPGAAVPSSERSEPQQTVRIAYKPEKRTLNPGDVLLTFIRPQTVVLSGDDPPIPIKQAPPFTSALPLTGLIRSQVAGRAVEALVVSDKKLSGRSRIYLDANMNGDLTDDPSFAEGEDFLPGQFFPAMLAGANDALWVLRPVRINAAVSPPTAETVENRLEITNRIYFSGQVEIPPASGVGTNPIKRHVILLDADSDGSYVDSDGSLLLWATPGPDATNTIGAILALSPTDKAVSHAGYKWNLSTDLSGQYVLIGKNLQADRKRMPAVGELFPAMKVQTLDGKEGPLLPPEKGYLLVYVWAAWQSAAQPAAALDFRDHYRKFQPRGLKLVGISVDYRKEDLAAFVRAQEIAWPQVFNGSDLSEGPAAELGVERFPVTFLVDPTGTVVSVGKNTETIWSFLDANLPK